MRAGARQGIKMISNLSRQEALELLKKYNKEPFHIRHGLTVEGVMRYFAGETGNGADEEYWGIAGLLHDIDFELYPEQHCVKAPELLREAGVSEEMIYSICSHGYGLCSDQEPKHLMEKILFACDELTGLIGAAARMRPSKSVMDMELSSLKKNTRTSALPRAVPGRSSARAQSGLAGLWTNCWRRPSWPCVPARRA